MKVSGYSLPLWVHEADLLHVDYRELNVSKHHKWQHFSLNSMLVRIISLKTPGTEKWLNDGIPNNFLSYKELLRTEAVISREELYFYSLKNVLIDSTKLQIKIWVIYCMGVKIVSNFLNVNVWTSYFIYLDGIFLQ